MLLTDVSWAESCAARQALVTPFQAWNCVGWIDDDPSFLVVATREIRADVRLPDSWLVDGPETLLDVASQLKPDAISVFALDRALDGGQVEISRVTGIWRERASVIRQEAMQWFWYTTDRGEMKPCSRGRLSDASGVPPGFVSELIFDEQMTK